MEEQEGIEEQEDPVHIQSSLFQGDSGAVVVLLDRRGDSATPLLTQWTYQAMVHKLLGPRPHQQYQNFGTKLPFTKNTLEFLEELVYVMIDPFKP